MNSKTKKFMDEVQKEWSDLKKKLNQPIKKRQHQKIFQIFDEFDLITHQIIDRMNSCKKHDPEAAIQLKKILSALLHYRADVEKEAKVPLDMLLDSVSKPGNRFVQRKKQSSKSQKK